MNYLEQYAAKKCSPEDAVSLIRKDDVVLTTGEPDVLLEALKKTANRLDGLHLYSVFGNAGQAGTRFYSLETSGHIHVTTTILSENEWKAWPDGDVDQVLVNLSEADQYIAYTCCPEVLLVQCSPLDEDGYFNMGIDAGCSSMALERGARVIVQVNQNMPHVLTDFGRVHISRVSAICESNELPSKTGIPATAPTEADRTIAGYIAERIPNGATIQLGGGIIPELAGRLLVNHKDLGIHTDFFNGAMVELMKKGAVNNSRKEIMNGVSVAGFFHLDPNDLSFLHNNTAIMLKKMSWVCDPKTISQLSDIVSVNMGLAVDFRAQVCSSSMGISNTGGIGSHLDFARGAKRSKNGKSFIVLRSTRQKEDGTVVSNILPALPEGSLVSIPRSDIMYVATEYGVANLRDLGVKERVKELISLAHPDFREWLLDEAKKNGFA